MATTHALASDYAYASDPNAAKPAIAGVADKMVPKHFLYADRRISFCPSFEVEGVSIFSSSDISGAGARTYPVLPT